MNHELYTTADKDRPSQICDGNGEAVLSLCKVCGQAEGDLQETCPGLGMRVVRATPEPQPDKTCAITIHNVLGWELDEAMTRKALEVASNWIAGSKAIDIYPQQRSPLDAPSWKRPGWLEWVVRAHHRSGLTTMEIHIIQRTLDAEFETHS